MDESYVKYIKCPFGYLLGKDFGHFPECDNHIGGSDCHPIMYRKCKDIKSVCGEKSDFGSKIIAAKIARDMSTDLKRYTEYKCPYCGGWHIGTDWT